MEATQPIMDLLLLAACLFLMSRCSAAAVSFSYDFSRPGVLDSAGLTYINDSSAAGDRISLTKASTWSTGLVAYPRPVRLWDRRTGKAASFSTSFSFAMNRINGTGGDPINGTGRGDGMAFFVRAFPASLPNDSRGAFLGLFNNYPGNPNSSPSLPAVGVEFDTVWNAEWDPPDISGDHVSIDVDKINQWVNYTKDLTNGVLSGTMSASITYDAASKLMVVTLRLASGSTHSVQAEVDFKDARVPQDAAVGFSAATGTGVQSNELLSWSFSSTDTVTLTDPSCKTKRWVIPTISAQGACLLAAILYIVILLIKTKRTRRLLEHYFQDAGGRLLLQQVLEATNNRSDDTMGISLPVPRKFAYQELSSATNGFSSDSKLGEGSFGEVHRGDLQLDPLTQQPVPVAVKRLTRQSLDRTRKDYVTEITILGLLYHRHLVKLVGWCDGERLLLVYEFMSNKSVDMYLHGPELGRLLTWPERYKIVLGVGYAIEYLHTGCPKGPILHRDIKPSNVMLDNEFKAKLGDFGLVRQMDTGQSSLGGTTMIGDRSYLDPICISKKTVSTASDMYSFGVFLLEIATGRKPAEVQGEGGLLSNTLVIAVRESCDKSQVLEMADQRLNDDFNRSQMERVMVVGRLCVQQQREDRPEIRNAVNMLLDLSHPVPPIRS